MPIEIKELHIRVTVNSSPESSASQAPTGSARPPPANGQTTDTDAIIAECVEQVLDILQRKAER
jgi:hypothetical protein